MQGAGNANASKSADAETELNINKRAEDELNNLSKDRSGDSGFVNIILPAVFGRAALITANADLKPITSRIRQSPKYPIIRGLLLKTCEYKKKK